MRGAATAAVLAAVVLHAAVVGAQAQTPFPTKPIRMIVAFAAGGGTDIVARVIGQRMGDALGQTVLIDNRPGAGGNVGTELVARAAPDGHTLLMAFTSHVTNPLLYVKAGYEPVKDFAPVSLVATAALVVAVNNNSPIKSLADLLETARRQPGKVTFGSSGNGTPLQLAGELLNRMGKVEMVHVPFKGIAPSLASLLGSEITMTLPTLLSVQSLWKSGKVRLLAITSERRSPIVPDLPTVSELGLTGFDAVTWYGILAPARTPPAVVARLNTESVRALKQPEVRDNFAAQGIDPVGSSAEMFANYLSTEREKWGRLIKQLGIKAE
ncbi:MAG: tripartite tricarboxylate transporter substrate binding protein [Proteobacteria bacterium]|nr:tripartite tricarboxylate transporter substrate binding protein [Burkholderiales bacterium]